MTTLELYLVMARAILLSFSGFASVPLIRDSLVLEHQVLTDVQLNDAIAISQASPGPLGLYIVIAGYFAGGVMGAVAGMLALASPSVLAIPIAAAVRRGRAQEIRGASSGIVIASCVLMAAAAVRLGPEAMPTLPFVLIGAAALGVLALTPLKPVWVILGAALVGSVL